MTWKKLQFPIDGAGKLADFTTQYTGDYKKQKDAEKALKRGINKLAELQHKLYAHDKVSLLIVLQAMDAAGKDSTIRHVMSGINPQGCTVTSFKKPSEEELDHNYLWRCNKALPRKGDIGIFNRSYYEEVLVVRVHPELLKYQKLPVSFSDGKPDISFWEQRYREINNFEQYLVENGTHILKFFLNVSKEEQKERFLSRIQESKKNWKFSSKDIDERKHWDDYQEAYEQALLHTSTSFAPWYVIPADNKWFMRLAVCEIIVDKLNAMGLQYPTLFDEQLSELKRGEQRLLNEGK